MGTKMFRKATFGYNKKDVCNYIEEIISSVNKELKAKDMEIENLRQEIRMLQSECNRLRNCLDESPTRFSGEKCCSKDSDLKPTGIFCGESFFRHTSEQEDSVHDDSSVQRSEMIEKSSFFDYNNTAGDLKKNTKSVKLSLPLQDPLKNILDEKFMEQENNNESLNFRQCGKKDFRKNSGKKSKSKDRTDILGKNYLNSNDEMYKLKQKMEVMKKLAAKAARRFEEDLNNIENI